MDRTEAAARRQGRTIGKLEGRTFRYGKKQLILDNGQRVSRRDYNSARRAGNVTLTRKDSRGYRSARWHGETMEKSVTVKGKRYDWKVTAYTRTQAGLVTKRLSARQVPISTTADRFNARMDRMFKWSKMGSQWEEHESPSPEQLEAWESES